MNGSCYATGKMTTLLFLWFESQLDALTNFCGYQQHVKVETHRQWPWKVAIDTRPFPTNVHPSTEKLFPTIKQLPIFPQVDFQGDSPQGQVNARNQ